MSRWLVLVSCLAVIHLMPAVPVRAEQPVLPPPPGPAAGPASPAPPATPKPPEATPAPAPAAPAAPQPSTPPAYEPGWTQATPGTPDAPPPSTPPSAYEPGWTEVTPAVPPSQPPATSEYPPVPPPPAYGAPPPMMPRGTAAPGATPILPPPPRPAPKRYPLAVMAVDAAWMLASWQLESPGVFLGGYIGGAPLVHALNGNLRSAWISGGLRAGAVVFTGIAILNAIGSSCSDCTGEGGLIVGGLVAGGLVMVVDWVVLAKKDPPPAAQPHHTPGWAVAPHVQVGQGGLQLGLGGWF